MAPDTGLRLEAQLLFQHSVAHSVPASPQRELADAASEASDSVISGHAICLVAPQDVSLADSVDICDAQGDGSLAQLPPVPIRRPAFGSKAGFVVACEWCKPLAVRCVQALAGPLPAAAVGGAFGGGASCFAILPA